MLQARQIQRSPCLGAGARQAFAPKRLHADHGAHHIAVDIKIAHMGCLHDLLHGFVNASVQAHGQAIAQGVDAFQQLRQLAALVAQHMEHGTKDFALQAVQVLEFDQCGRHKMALRGYFGSQWRLMSAQTLGLQSGDMFFDMGLGFGVDHRAYVGGQQGRVATAQFLHGAVQHGEEPVGAIALHAQQAQRRAALACAVKSRGHNVQHSLLHQRRRIHDHRVLAAGLGHQHHALAIGTQALRGLLVEQARHFGGTGKQHAGHTRIGDQSCAHCFATAWQQLQHGCRNACLMQQAHGFHGDQRRLLCRFGQHYIAGGQRCSNLAGEDGQRKIPGADADHGAYARCQQPGLILPAHLRRVVAQKIYGFAHFRDGIRSRLAGLAHQQRLQRLDMGLVVVGSRFQQGGALCCSGLAPRRLGLFGSGQCLLQLLWRGFWHMAQHLLVIGGVGDGVGLLRRRGRFGPFQALGQSSQHLVVAQIQPVGILALRAQQVSGQGNARVGLSYGRGVILAFNQGLVCGGSYQIRYGPVGVGNAVHKR